MTTTTDSPFHAGERALQARVGVAERMARAGSRAIRDFMPDQHRELFGKLPFLVVGSLDAEGGPWASILFGRPGFVATPDARTMAIAALPVPGDPLAANLAVGAPVGLLGIELETRRRNRMNGRVIALGDGGFAVRVEQSFGNCPKYIQLRAHRFVDEPGAPDAPLLVRPERAILSAQANALVRRADTFFIASAASGEGVDVSHRGGKPSFVRVEARDGRTVLTAPDFSGNLYFNTLGNIAVYPRAGLLFANFDTGDVLALTGGAEIVFDGPELTGFAGAERLLRVTVEAGVWLAQGLPLRWSAPIQAPQVSATGAWGA